MVWFVARTDNERSSLARSQDSLATNDQDFAAALSIRAKIVNVTTAMKTLVFLPTAFLLLTAEADQSAVPCPGFPYSNTSPLGILRALSRVFVCVLAYSALAVSTHAHEITLFDRTTTATVVYAVDGGAPIAKAAELLGHDLRALSGHDPLVSSTLDHVKGPAVIIGRVDAAMIAAILRTNKISTSQIGRKWETYGRAVVPAPWNPKEKALVIFGSDTRGTIWGVIDLTREMGVSPWEWWADVAIRRVDRIAVDASLHYSREPSVKYRGIFLNAGEHGMNPWVSKTFDPAQGNMGPRSYARIFELMWRLKANTIWPAMTKVDTPFNAILDNARTAAGYAIVRGSSHVEMLLRTNSREWDPATRGPYNWLLNRQEMIHYWTESVQKFGSYENLYTVGLRNMDDFPMQGVNTPEQMADVLHEVINGQRKILSDELHRPASEAPQVFTAYKEVLPAYDTGRIQLPPDITINWPDDNFGYIRRLSNTEERKRSGGSGIYYHDTFWGPPNAYMWLQSTHPALMWEEMTKAWQFDARQLWILNVGSIKPGEFLTQLFLAIAFDVPRFNTCSSVRVYMRDWAAENFGRQHADRVADLLWGYYQLAFERAPEFMGWTEVFPETAIRQTEFNAFDFGDENARRVEAYQQLVSAGNDLAATLTADRRDAFYQLVQYQMLGAAAINLRQLYLDKTILYGLQHRASANVYAQKAKEAQEKILTDARIYNEEMAGGKWRHMIDPLPKDLPIYETPHFPRWSDNGEKKCGVQVEGGAFFDGSDWWTPDLPVFHPELKETHFIDVFAEHALEGAWTATAAAPIDAFHQATLDVAKTTPVPWIKLSKTAGRFSPADQHFEDRILVSIDWTAAPIGGAGEVIVTGPAFKQPIAVHVRLAQPNPAKNVSFIEADRIVSIYATHTDSLNGRWEVLDGLGHTGASLRTRLDMKSIDAMNEVEVRKAPSATYRFATSTTDDRATLSAVALPTFPITTEHGVRLAVSIDNGPLHVLDFFAPEFSAAWREHALSNKAIQKVSDLRLAAGAHTLSVYALDPGVALDRFEVAFTGAPRAYGPVPETRVLK